MSDNVADRVKQLRDLADTLERLDATAPLTPIALALSVNVLRTDAHPQPERILTCLRINEALGNLASFVDSNGHFTAHRSSGAAWAFAPLDERKDPDVFELIDSARAVAP